MIIVFPILYDVAKCPYHLYIIYNFPRDDAEVVTMNFPFDVTEPNMKSNQGKSFIKQFNIRHQVLKYHHFDITTTQSGHFKLRFSGQNLFIF